MTVGKRTFKKLIKKHASRQLLLPLRYDEDYLTVYFEKITNKTISLTITDNSSTMLSVRKKGKAILVRLHRMFLDAQADVIKEIAEFITSRKSETPLLRKFIKQNSNRVKKIAPKRITIKPLGKYHNLDEIYESLNNEYFEGTLSCPITWGTKSHRCAVRKRTLGSYSRHTNTIRINPILDRKKAPRYFIEFVVYHEMLHADMTITENNGRKLVHPEEFRKRERLFIFYKKAMEWEKRWV